jgi:hypothetical protein
VLGEAARRAGEGVITIALDGENPWEAFPDAGHAFRQHLHAGLLGGPSRGITLDAASERPPVGKVRRLHTGSWINSDFAIWIGHAEDRRAWRVLDDARRAIADAPPDRARIALERLLPAEGSDWMWWYGEEFSTPFAGTFDRLFRAHVRAAWRALGKEPPAELDHPISAQARLPVEAPIALVRPKLETAAPWVRWAGAGRVVFGRGASMARGEVHAQGLSFGWSPRPDPALWLRVEPVDPLPAEPQGAVWRVKVADVVLELPYGQPGTAASGDAQAVGDERAVVARVPAARLPAGAVAVRVEVALGDRVIASYPGEGAVMLPRGAPDPELEFWAV